jgi:hypothetical protein
LLIGEAMFRGVTLTFSAFYNFGSKVAVTLTRSVINLINLQLVLAAKTLAVGLTKSTIALMIGLAIAFRTMSALLVKGIVVASMATAKALSGLALAMIGGWPIGAALLVIQILTIGIDMADPAGYNLIDTMILINHEIYKEVNMSVDKVNKSNYEASERLDENGKTINVGKKYKPLRFPAIVGPQDKLMLQDAPRDVIISKCLAVLPIYPIVFYNGILFDNEKDKNIIGSIEGNIIDYDPYDPDKNAPKLNATLTMINGTKTSIIGNLNLYNEQPELASNPLFISGNLLNPEDEDIILGSIVGNIVGYGPLTLTPRLDDSVTDPVTGNFIGNIIGNDPTMYECLLSYEFENIIKDTSIPFVNDYINKKKVYIDRINAILATPEDDFTYMSILTMDSIVDDLGRYVKNFLDINGDEITMMAGNIICNNNGGFVHKSSDGSYTCSYTKEMCINTFQPMKPKECKKGPPPDCSNTPSVECTGGDPNILEDYDIDKVWSDKDGVCKSTNGVIKSICQSNNLSFNIDTGVCIFTEDVCLSKAGTPVVKSDGTLDCHIPVGQQIIEALLGKTFTSSLVQTFDPQQYKCPKNEMIDMHTEGGILDRLCRPGGSVIDWIVDVALLIILAPLIQVILGVCSLRAYNCRDPCPPGHDFYGAVCIGPKNIPNPPCEPGWNFNSITSTCEAPPVKSALVTGELPSKCPEGYHPNVPFLPTFCIKDNCDRDPSDIDENDPIFNTCRQACMSGWTDTGGICWSNEPITYLKPLVPASRAPCDVGYTWDNISTCWSGKAKGIGEIGIPPTYCDPKVSKRIGITCWNHCNANERDIGLVCERCPEYGKDQNGNPLYMINNGAGTCYKPCDDGYVYDGSYGCNWNPQGVGIGIIPTNCPPDYTSVGVTCVRDPPSGYETRPGDLFNYWLIAPYSYSRPSTGATQKDNEVCGGAKGAQGEPALQNWISGIGTCTGWTDIRCSL